MIAAIPKQYRKTVMIGAAIGGGLFLLYVMNKGIKGAAAGITSGLVGGAVDAAEGILIGAYEAVPEAIKPTNTDNVVNQAFNKQWEFWTGSPTFGGWIYDVTH